MLARYAVLPSPALASDPQVLLLSKLKAPINPTESTLLQVFFLKNLKPFGINTYEKQGEGWVIMVNHLLETSHPLSSSALRFCVSAASPSSILRTHFQVPYPVRPLLATLTKTPGVWGYSSHFRTLPCFHSKPPLSDFSTCQRSSLSPYFVTSLLPPVLTVSSRCAVDRRAKAGDNFKSTTLARVAAISEEEVNEHFSKHTDAAGILRLRIHGDAAVDRGAVRRGDSRAGDAGLRGVFDGDAHERGPGEAAGSEQNPDRATGPGKFAYRGFERPDGSDHAANGLDAV